MELIDLEGGLKSIAAVGSTLNCQEIAGVTAGLTVLNGAANFREVCFWGKIFGQSADYYIVYGLKEGGFEFPDKVFYFSGEDFVLNPLPLLTEENAAKVIELAGGKPFSGKVDALLEE